MTEREVDGAALSAPLVVAVATVALGSLGALLVVQEPPSPPAVAVLVAAAAGVFAVATVQTGDAAREAGAVALSVAVLAAVAWRLTVAVGPVWASALLLTAGGAAVAYGLERYERHLLTTAEGRR